ncbi:MAG: diguanylate cyclase [Rhizobiales bacterium 63-7]|nr:MAG: diguanylate cyclase [Rhizobiales bacterium 63-7]
MYKVVTCLAFEHDLRLVVLAGILCFLSSYVAFLLLRRGRAGEGRARLIWLLSAGAAGGFGIWTTHFVAMLAYDPGVIIGYALSQTLLSLAIAVLTTSAAAACAVFLGGMGAALAAGLLFGVGVSSMHFIGMAAIEFPGTLVWERMLVLAAIVLAVVFSVPAFLLHGAAHRRIAIPALLMSLGIVLMHFTAMGSVSVIPGAGAVSSKDVLSAHLMVMMITVVALSLLFSGFAAALFAMRAEKAAADGEANFKRLVQAVNDYAIYMIDLDGRVSNWNAGAERALGYSEAEIVGQSFHIFHPEEERRRGAPARALTTARSEGRFEVEAWRVRKDGTRFWAYVVIEPIYDEEKRLGGYAKITRDCTGQMLAAQKLQQASQNLNLALNHMANAICLFDRDEKLVLHNGRLGEIFGFAPETDLTGRTFRELCSLRVEFGIEHLSDIDAFYERHRRLIVSAEGGEDVRVIANGKTVRTIHRPTGDGAWVTTIEDITERVRSEERIAHLARHDTLTGLPNRRRFTEILDAAIDSADGTGARVAAICIDLDKFKEVNDTFGHASGDALLSTLAQRMVKGTDPSETVGRFGGDEFVALKSYSEQSELQGFLTRLVSALSEHVDLGHTTLAPAASLGVAIYPQDAQDRERLLGNADLAMYRSKYSLEEKISFYEAGMDEAARERRALARDIAPALEEEQFFLAYQVQKAVRTNATTGYEVLLRWSHPKHGLIPPSTFIPLAEESGAITALGEWVLERACREAASWPQPHRIAVNLSPLQLVDTLLPEKVRRVLAETGLSPARLELEVTESAIIADKARALHVLRQIKALGVTIAIDDFGTGYSSLETLRSFPFDKIKLDRSFVEEIGNRQSKAFVRAIVALGKSLDVSVLAEGVETSEQFRFLLAEGCDEVQGFLFGRPGSPDQMKAEAASGDRLAG